MCNSGAEANENALKIASFETGRNKILCIRKSFHGRTSAAVAATYNTKIQSPINKRHYVDFISMNDLGTAYSVLKKHQTAAVLIEGIQGVGGLNQPDNDFLKGLLAICQSTRTLLILDEVQSGYGRTGKFFAHQWANIQPHIITTGKGMGNGFPIAGVLIHPNIKPWHGELGTTFGGNHLACVAGRTVLDVIAAENLMENALVQGQVLKDALETFEAVKAIKGKGLMLGITLATDAAASIRARLLYEQKIFTDATTDPTTLRLLPPLSIGKKEVDYFLQGLARVV